jgi:serine/threonine protein kinase
MFKQEVATLKRLSERNHAHLMRLELTYEYQERFHLLFRWADGNLRDYWERHPRPTNIPRTHSFAVWVSQQCLGLAEALMIIHECPPDSDLTTNDETNGLALQRTNGRHGDIKPENILWFQPHECNDDRNKDQGKLVISDFGLTEFHRDETGLVSPMNIAMSPTYSAPEYEVSETISQSFDIWSMGCVLCK